MRIEETTVQKLKITEATGLDPITVILEDIESGRGQITIICHARAWTAYWGGMGDRSVEQFVASCHPEYVADNLKWGMEPTLKRYEKHEYSYLVRIVEAVQAALRQRLAIEKVAA